MDCFFFFWKYYNCNFTDTGTKRLVKASFRAEAVCQCRSYLLGSLTDRCAETWSSGLSAGFPYAVVLLSAECTSLCEKLSTVQIGLGDGMWVRFLKFAASLPTHEPLKNIFQCWGWIQGLAFTKHTCALLIFQELTPWTTWETTNK